MEAFFTGKRILVTGAGRGIGKAIVMRLIELGADVYGLSVSAEGLATLAKQCPDVHPVQVDLMNWDATRQAVQTIQPIDLLVNNAGIFIPESFLNASSESFNRIMDVNVKAVIIVSQVVAKSLIERKVPGAIVNISSVASQLPLQDHSIYCSSKAALDALTRSMALELGPHKIRVNSLNPTVILTDMGRQGWSDPAKSGPLLNRIPLHQFGEVDDAVNATLFLLSDHSKFINGVHLPLDGGLLAT